MTRLGLFDAFGVELEYMIVDRDTLNVAPIADVVLGTIGGEGATYVERGPIEWSNELVLHVLELKTNGPASRLGGLGSKFQLDVQFANELLEKSNACLMPTGMHPWMDPNLETRIWPHEYNEVYRTYDRIFGCRGHGWANLQSSHLNLPFDGDEEFRRLHDAIRAVLPVIPALAASSPYADGRYTGVMDYRLTVYRDNSRAVPSMTGGVIPEPVASEAEYRSVILDRIYKDLETLDADGVLRHEWANSRGAIARFERGTIEIRTVDSQECPNADLAVLALITETVKHLTEVAGAASHNDRSGHWLIDGEVLKQILSDCTVDADEAVIHDKQFLSAFDLKGPIHGGEFWIAMAERLDDGCLSEWGSALDVIFNRGPLARRLFSAAGPTPSRVKLAAVYQELSGCLQRGEMFDV